MTFTEFKRFADENNIVPVSTEIYSKMITDSVMLAKHKGVLQEIRQEIDDADILSIKNVEYHRGLTFALDVIDKHIKEYTE